MLLINQLLINTVPPDARGGEKIVLNSTENELKLNFSLNKVTYLMKPII